MTEELHSCFATCPAGLLCTTRQVCVLMCRFCHEYASIIAVTPSDVINKKRLKLTMLYPSNVVCTATNVLTLQDWEYWKANRFIGISVKAINLEDCSLFVPLNKSFILCSTNALFSVNDICDQCSSKIDNEFNKRVGTVQIRIDSDSYRTNEKTSIVVYPIY
jgi:hypothetical protein